MITGLRESYLEEPVHFQEFFGSAVLNHVIQMGGFLLADPIYAFLLLKVEIHIHVLQKACILF